MSEHTHEVFSNRLGTTKAVVCSCGFATTYTALSNDADEMVLRHFHQMHDGAKRRTADLEAKLAAISAPVTDEECKQKQLELANAYLKEHGGIFARTSKAEIFNAIIAERAKEQP